MKNLTGKLLLSSMLTATISLGSISDLSAQVSFAGQPKSFSTPERMSMRSTSEVTPLITLKQTKNIDDLMAQSNWDSELSTRPYYIGERIATSLDMAKDGEQIRLQDGTIIYRLTIQSDGAKALYPTYSQFFIPRGGRLFVYNESRSVVNGAYTYDTNPEGGRFASEPVPGDKIVLEYESNVAGEAPQITVDGLVYIFRDQIAKWLDVDPGENASDYPSCMINANCPEGEAYYDQKAGITQIYITYDDGSTTSCSGTLLNNTKQDFTPYIITAAHCVGSGEVFPLKQTSLDQWIFSFHYMKPGCSNSATARYYAKSMVGCTKVAYLPTNSYSDGLLLKLKQEIPADYRVFYNGWDRRGGVPPHGVGLHHPMGDAMKISIFEEAPTLSYWKEPFSGIYGASKAHFKLSFTTGTEGGSSGSSLFNPEKLVIGTLTGGGEACQFRKADDFYGRMNAHWDWFKDKGEDRQMGTFLDPVGNGTAETLQGIYRNDMRYFYPVYMLNAAAASSEQNKIILKWNAPSGADLSGANIEYQVMRNNTQLPASVKHETGKTYLEYIDQVSPEDVINGTVSYRVRAIYTDKNGTVETAWSPKTSALIGELTKTIDPQVEKTTEGYRVSWKRPAHYAEWSKIGYTENPEYLPVPVEHYKQDPQVPDQLKHLVYRETWHIGSSLNDVQNESEALYVVQYNVMPTKAGSKLYTYIREGSRKKSQPVVVEFSVPENWKAGEWVSVKLPKPLKIKPYSIVFVGFQTDNTEQPNAICYLNGSADEFAVAESSYFFNPSTHNYDRGFYTLEHSKVKTFGNNYLGIRLVLSDSEIPLEAPVKDVKWGTNGCFSFPKIKQYVIKRDGEEIVRTSACVYTDKTNTNPDAKYTVEVVYTDPINTVDVEGLNPDAVQVFPTSVEDYVNVQNASKAQRIQLYSMDGHIVKAWDKISDAEHLDLSELPAGSYIFRIDMPGNPLAVRIIKR
ncbi:T9SS type A sorting domain-containing protein [Porphyromonas crevioricanis]|nr:T9SS type A sorting domain-containing protein [Porphyromonas crevioricanis]